MSKLHYFINANKIKITETINQHNKKSYRIYCDESRTIWFLLSIPFIGNIIAIMGLVCSFTRTIPSKSSKNQPKHIFFDSEKIKHGGV